MIIIFFKSSRFFLSSNPFYIRIHESCPACGKSIQSNQSRKSKSSSNDSHRLIISPVLQCLSCRKRVGYCFICNLPVRKGLFVFCPGTFNIYWDVFRIWLNSTSYLKRMWTRWSFKMRRIMVSQWAWSCWRGLSYWLRS